MKSEYKKELVSFIQEKLKDVDHLMGELKECKGTNSVLRRARGSIPHDFYNACERIFNNHQRSQWRYFFKRSVA